MLSAILDLTTLLRQLLYLPGDPRLCVQQGKYRCREIQLHRRGVGVSQFRSCLVGSICSYHLGVTPVGT